jgi:SAM-dependent methyltransferase
MTQRFDPYDRRGYPTLGVAEGYAAWAPCYDETADNRFDIALLSVLTSVDFGRVARAADLACGSGRIGCWLRARGAERLDGIDVSAPMLDRAALKKVYDSLTVADITRTGLADGGYDVVVCCLATCHVENLAAFYSEGARLLRPHARMVIVDYHPFMLLKGVPTHFELHPGTPIAISNVIHLFSDHVRAACAAGLVLIELQEQIVAADWIADRPGMAMHAGQPISFAMVWGKRLSRKMARA